MGEENQLHIQLIQILPGKYPGVCGGNHCSVWLAMKSEKMHAYRVKWPFLVPLSASGMSVINLMIKNFC